MKAKKLVLTAIMSVMISLGIGGTSSAATPLDNLPIFTIEKTVETQELSAWPRIRDALLGRSNRDRDRRRQRERNDYRRTGGINSPSPQRINPPPQQRRRNPTPLPRR